MNYSVVTRLMAACLCLALALEPAAAQGQVRARLSPPDGLSGETAELSMSRCALSLRPESPLSPPHGGFGQLALASGYPLPIGGPNRLERASEPINEAEPFYNFSDRALSLHQLDRRIHLTTEQLEQELGIKLEAAIVGGSRYMLSGKRKDIDIAISCQNPELWPQIRNRFPNIFNALEPNSDTQVTLDPFSDDEYDLENVYGGQLQIQSSNGNAATIRMEIHFTKLPLDASIFNKVLETIQSQGKDKMKLLKRLMQSEYYFGQDEAKYLSLRNQVSSIETQSQAERLWKQKHIQRRVQELNIIMNMLSATAYQFFYMRLHDPLSAQQKRLEAAA